MTSGMNLATNSFKSQVCDSRTMISLILRLICVSKSTTVCWVTVLRASFVISNQRKSWWTNQIQLKARQINLTNLAALSVACFLDLIWPLLGEGNTEKSQLVVICGFHIHMSLNQALPLAHKWTKLVGGKVHALIVQNDQIQIQHQPMLQGRKFAN